MIASIIDFFPKNVHFYFLPGGAKIVPGHLCIPMSQGKEYLQCSQPFLFLTVEASHNDDRMGRRNQYDKDRPSESTLRNPYIRSTDSPRTR